MTNFDAVDATETAAAKMAARRDRLERAIAHDKTVGKTLKWTQTLAHYDRICQAIARLATRGTYPTDEGDRIALMVAGLQPHDEIVRDALLSRAATGTEVDAAEKLFEYLARVTPAPYCARPATMAGFVAYMRGNVDRARVMLQLAIKAAPDDSFASLIAEVVADDLPRAALLKTVTVKLSPPAQRLIEWETSCGIDYREIAMRDDDATGPETI